MKRKQLKPKLKLIFSDGTYKYSSFITKRKIGPSSTMFKDLKGIFEGTARVTYAKDYYNEFDFSSREDFMNKILPCLEEDMYAKFQT